MGEQQHISGVAEKPLEEKPIPLEEIGSREEALQIASDIELRLRILNVENNGFPLSGDVSDHAKQERSRLTHYLEKITESWGLSEAEYTDKANAYSDGEFERRRSEALQTIIEASKRCAEILAQTNNMKFSYDGGQSELHNEFNHLKKLYHDTKMRWVITDEEIESAGGTLLPE
ncbi:MAG: hypothetical protein ACOZAN_01520 [Patescibacteria group bacterium]